MHEDYKSELLQIQTPETIAYQLMLDIFFGEDKLINYKYIKTTRKDILDTYKQCLEAVNSTRQGAVANST